MLIYKSIADRRRRFLNRFDAEASSLLNNECVSGSTYTYHRIDFWQQLYIVRCSFVHTTRACTYVQTLRFLQNFKYIISAMKLKKKIIC